MSGSLTTEDNGALKTALNTLKSRELNCAVGAGGKIADIRLHQSAGGGTLRHELQKDKDLAKFAVGTATRMQDDQSNLFLSLDKDMPNGFCKRLARQLRFGGVRIVTIMVDGKVVQSGRDEEDEAVDGAPGPSQQQGAAANKIDAEAEMAINLRVRAAAEQIKRFAVKDPNSRVARALLTKMVEGRHAGVRPSAAQVETFERLASAAVSAKEAFIQRVRGARDELARGEEAATGENKETLHGLVAGMKQAVVQERFDEAADLCRQARSQATRVLASVEDAPWQQAVHERMVPVLARVKETTFAKSSTDMLKKLKPGNHFQAVINAEEACRAEPTQEACNTVTKAAAAYLAHYEKLISFQKNKPEARAKKANAETALTGAHHMKLALRFEELGALPWDAETAAEAAELFAAFKFETASDDYERIAPAKPVGKDSGVSAAFYVDAYDSAAGPLDYKASERVMVFKPMDGERSVDGFPIGGSAPREALAYALSQSVVAMTGLDLGCPESGLTEVSVRSIDVQGYNKAKSGAAPALDATKTSFVGSVQQYALSDGPLSKNMDRGLDRFPPEECHRIALLDILTLNLDRHAANLLVRNRPDGTPIFIPIDNGLALPSAESMSRRGPVCMNSTQGNALLALPGSYAPLSDDMKHRLELLDPAALRAAATAAKQQLASRHPDINMDTLVPDEAFSQAERAACFLKLAAPTLSPAVIQIAIANEHKILFTCEESQFDSLAMEVIATYLPQAEALRVIYCECEKLDWFLFNLVDAGWLKRIDTAEDRSRARTWLARNAEKALKVYREKLVPEPGYLPA